MMNMMLSPIQRICNEFKACSEDQDLIQIGCSFGMESNNVFQWKATMLGPQKTPYGGGLFNISITFPQDYPIHGPEFKFINPIYHLNVDFEKEKGHICLSTLNEWKTTGHVTNKPIYGVKQAMFDIFCLFYNQGIESAYSPTMAAEYKNDREGFDKKAKEWTEKYASLG